MEKKKLLCTALAALMLCLNLVGCGAKNAATDDMKYFGNSSSSTAGGGAIFDKVEMDSSGIIMEESKAESAPMAPPMENGWAADTPSAAEPTAPELPEYSKLIYRANLELETTEFDSVVQSLEGIVSTMGGYFENQSISNYGTYRYGYYVIRVPQGNFNALLSQVGELCLVRHQNKTSENVSEAYYDLEARLSTQRTKLDRLQELLRKAESMEDIITIESAISDTELQIEYLTGSLRKYDSLIDFSTVTIDLHEVYKLSNVEEPTTTFGDRLSSAFTRGIRSAVDNLEDFVISLAYNWLSILIFLAIFAAVLLLIRRLIKKRRQKKYIPPVAPTAPEAEKKGE